MSKNFELLQQAEFALGHAPKVAADDRAGVADRAVLAPSPLLSGLEPMAREEALKLVQHLFLDPRQTSPKAVLFAPVDGHGGSVWLSAVTAQLLAESVPGSVCVVEGNLRAPSLPAVFGVEPDRGFVEALRQEGPIREFAKRIGPENFWLLPSGAPVQDAALLLNSDRLKERVSELRRDFDFVLVNAPSLSAFADASVLGRVTDGVVLVVEANATRREAASRAIESLRSTNIPVLGAVLNNRTFPIPPAVYKRL